MQEAESWRSKRDGEYMGERSDEEESTGKIRGDRKEWGGNNGRTLNNEWREAFRGMKEEREKVFQ